MSKQVFYVGVDVGKDELWAVVDNHRPRRFRHSTVGTKAMVSWARKAGGEVPLHICMEATGVYSRGLAVRLCALDGVSVSIVNPAQIAAFARAQLRRSKTDGIDARVIFEFTRSQKPPVWTPEPASLRKLYHLVSQADVVRANIRQWENRKHTQQYTPDTPQVVDQTQRTIVTALRRQLVILEKEIEKLCRQDEHIKCQMDLMSTIPGVAHRTAARLLAYGSSTLTDRSQRALVAHAGLAPAHRQSGTSLKGKSHIAKQGDRRLRTALFMPALVAAHHNPILKTFYRRLLEKGKPKMLALVAVMKKLLIMIRAILKNNLPFNPNYALDR
jgi:transposase